MGTAGNATHGEPWNNGKIVGANQRTLAFGHKWKNAGRAKH